MLLKWLPWRWMVRALARAHGFLDPLRVVARLENLAQPSEVAAPIELLRAGIALHARGAINGKLIQQNLDWVWPYWVTRQFDPTDSAFLPRGFSFSQVNLTNRNWTAVGVPGCEAMPIVDPRGLLTPYFDGWSLDAWIVAGGGPVLLPSRQEHAEQHQRMQQGRLTVHTLTSQAGAHLDASAWAQADDQAATCHARYAARLDGPGWLVVSLRPLNPEGVGLVERIELEPDRRGWMIDGKTAVRFDRPVDRHACSTYSQGDVAIGLLERPEEPSCKCKVGLATAAAMFELPANEPSGEVSATVDLAEDKTVKLLFPRGKPQGWQDALEGSSRLQVPDERFAQIQDAAVRSLVLLSPEDVYPGPYTYKRFWFRDAVLMAHAMLNLGMADRVRTIVDRFIRRQHISGYFHSQSGEWDSNGQVLWLLGRLRRLTGEPLAEKWHKPIGRAGGWILHKRTSPKGTAPHAGLLPAGFSAEHLGTNDYYYWDDFWSVAGLESAAELMAEADDNDHAEQFRQGASELRSAIDRSLQRSEAARMGGAVPASPYRRMDSGAIGSIACVYPLTVWEPNDPRILATLEYLASRCLADDMLLLDMIHSGRNAYLTLSIAQALLRAGDDRAFGLIEATARAASPTGHWPEAIHPHTGGGCMGDGHHGWASAEWTMMMRNLFVREEAGRLVLCSGLPDKWLDEDNRLRFGPTPTPWGPVSVEVQCGRDQIEVRWEGDFRTDPPPITIDLAGQQIQPEPAEQGHLSVSRMPEGAAR